MKYLVPEEISKISVQFFETRVLDQKGLVKTFKINWFRHLIWLIEHLLLPGIILHYVLRKRYIEEATLSIIDKGEVTQVVILAAGFDSLACRSAKKFPWVNFIEVSDTKE